MTPPRTAASPRRPVPAPERPRHLEVVRGRPVPGRRPPLMVLLVALATAVALFVLVTAQVMLGQAGINESRLSSIVAEKRAKVEEMSLDVARMSAPGAVAARARALGMVPATDVYVLSTGRVSGSVAGGR